MAQDHRAPRADVVDVALVVGVPKISALGAFDKARRAANSAKGAYRRVDAARNDKASAFEKGLVQISHGFSE